MIGTPMNAKDSSLHGSPAIDQDWLALARALTPKLNDVGPTIDANKALPREILDALFEAKLFRMFLPRSLGGAELDLPTFFQVILALAEGDASAAWSVAQSNGCAMSAAYMEPAAAQDLFSNERAVLAWGFPAGRCTAMRVDGGWRVTGAWGFGSGSRHATWLGGHCQVVDEHGGAMKREDGAPLERTALFPRSDVQIIDNQWNVIGLRGTGSDTYAVTDLFVPAKYSVVARAVGGDQQRPQDTVIQVESERREPGPLYRFSPTMAYQAGFSAVALGLARAMLNSFVMLASQKSPAGGALLLRDNAVIQERVAISQARLAAMNAWMMQSLRESWEGCLATGQHAFEHRVNMRLACTYAIREAAKVVEGVYADAGATAIFAAHPFERRLRDMHAVAQQIQANPMHLQTAGQYYLGMKPSTRFI
jgi:indole-3-acetate monooxygenase